MRKHLLTAILAVAIVLSMAACSGTGADETSTSSTQESTTEPTAPETTEPVETTEPFETIEQVETEVPTETSEVKEGDIVNIGNLQYENKNGYRIEGEEGEDTYSIKFSQVDFALLFATDAEESENDAALLQQQDFSMNLFSGIHDEQNISYTVAGMEASGSSFYAEYNFLDIFGVVISFTDSYYNYTIVFYAPTDEILRDISERKEVFDDMLSELRLKENVNLEVDTASHESTGSNVDISVGQANALKAAGNYLQIMPFSYDGLIDQLKFDGYTDDEAAYAADNCGADWFEQAEKAGENYLEIMPFSRSGLIDQLEFDGFTYEQAAHGADANGL